ncbi:MAG: thioredoxin domain-containing protein, partial [Candidatus Limnocylindrales bacterium]
MTDTPQFTNRLIHETSPYLLQHAHNPVNWYPWGDEALTRARELDQPIFLSIGYAACHWCHVMERESFEDEATAADLNAGFVSIKVDREERPDLDSIYMNALQALTGQGGWPMSMFLTPDGRPFYGGTYFPDRPRHGMPAFRVLLARIAEVWDDRREWIESTANKLAERVRDEQDAPARLMAALAELPDVDPADRLADATKGLLKSFDPVNGGWGEAPKFPQAMSVEFLLQEHLRTGAREPRLVAERTLDAMAAGGIYDHLGGGFARYSTDARWLVPHFEKMLYDNALLARAYTHAAELTGDPQYAYVARETLDFVAHEMRVPPAGAFAASLDADTEGVEGATYTWDAAEIREILGHDAPLFESAYGVTEEGNWEGRTILTRTRDDTDLAVEHELPRDEIAEELAKARTELLRARDERPQPARDDKVLTAWNGLMIGAFADAGRALGEPAFVRIATEAADFILAELRAPEPEEGAA